MPPSALATAASLSISSSVNGIATPGMAIGCAIYGVYGKWARSYRPLVPSRSRLPSAQQRLATAAKRERARLGWTQEQAAEIARLNIRHYQKIEDGAVNVTLRTVELLGEAFGVDIADLLKS